MASKYVDNTILGSGTVGVVVGPLTSSEFSLADVVFAGGATVLADLVFCGLEIFAGTGAAPKSYRILSIGGLGGAIAALNAPLEDGRCVAGQQYRITRGCNDSDGSSPIPAALLVGPKATVTAGYRAAASGDTVYVRYSGRDYDEKLRATRSGADGGRLELYRAGVAFNIIGYKDLDASNLPVQFTQDPNPAYLTKLDGNPYLFLSAGEQLTETYFPVIRPLVGDLSPMIRFTPFFYGANATTSLFRFLVLDVTNTAQAVYFDGDGSGQGASANPYTVRFDRCVLGTGVGGASDGFGGLVQKAFYDNSKTYIDTATSKIGTSKTFQFSKCRLLATGQALYSAVSAALEVSDCELKHTGNSSTVLGSGVAAVELAGTTGNGDKQTLRARFRRNRITVNVVDATHQPYGIIVHDDTQSEATLNEGGLDYCEHCEITNNRIVLNDANGHCVYIKGTRSYNVSGNWTQGSRAYSIDSTGSPTNIRIAAGANCTLTPTYQRLRTLIRGAVAAGSTTTTVAVTAAGLGTLNQAANAYRGRILQIRRADGSGIQTRMISASSYAAATLTLTHITGAAATTFNHGNWSPTPAAGDLYEILEDQFNQSVIVNNWCEHLQTTYRNGRGIQVGIGADGCFCSGNTCLGADVGIWVLSNHNTVCFNKLYAGEPLQVKGGSWNRVFNNSLCMGPLSAAIENVIDLLDYSAYDHAAYSDGQIRHWQHYSKCQGNVITNNIVANIGKAGDATGKGYCIFELTAGNGKLAGTQPSWLPAGQHNYIDRNLYWRDDNADAISNLGTSRPLMRFNQTNYGTDPDGTTAIGQVRAFWESGGAPYSSYFSQNDAHSIYGNPKFVDPANGDFRISMDSPAWNIGGTGGPIGAVFARIPSAISATTLGGALRTILATDATVADLVSGGSNARIYPTLVPESATYPCITYQEISYGIPRGLANAAGPATSRVQLNCWARTPLEAKQLAEAVRLSLDGFQGPVGDIDFQLIRMVNRNDTLEDSPDQELERFYGVMIDFMTTYAETIGVS